MQIRDYVEKNRCIMDGAFGTYFSERFAWVGLPEEANILAPDKVKEIHKEYLKAGARVIRTNTFSSNTGLLHPNFEQVERNIRAGIQCGKAAISEYGGTAFLLGDIGPIPYDDTMEEEDITEEYRQIVQIMLDEGVDGINFETLSDFKTIQPVIEELQDPNPYVMVLFSMNQFGYSAMGYRGEELLKEASQVERIDVVGFNCGVGPTHMSEFLQTIELPVDKKIAALPNAGYPKRRRTHMEYSNHPEYYSLRMKHLVEQVSIDFVGGCCGTNPSYIWELTKEIPKKQVCEPKRLNFSEKQRIRGMSGGFLYEADGQRKKKKLIAVELIPPLNIVDADLLDAANRLKKNHVDVLTFPDSPSGRTRVDSILMATKVKTETNMTVMPHMCCRDKNAIAIRSLVMGAYLNGIRDFLVVTGDPIPSISRQDIKGVFNFDSTGFMRILGDMNEELFSNNPLIFGGAINQGRRKFEREITRVQKKMDLGAKFFFTQPAFSNVDVERIQEIKEKTGATILCGIMPLISRKNALFMKNEIASIPVTDEIVDRYGENMSKAEGERVGVEIAREMIRKTEDFVDGYYFSFPFNRVYLLDRIIKKEEDHGK